jgi:NAD(P)-dependent dehydrogenase (short-subunit alcohol dehydrogenase family)
VPIPDPSPDERTVTTSPRSKPAVALVTGASRGLGEAVARFLAAEDFDLVLVARTPGPLAAVARELRARGRTIVEVIGDVAEPDVRHAIAEAVDRCGGLNLLFNNASELGPSPLSPIARVPLDALEQIYRVNVIAPVALVQLLEPYLARRRGLVVNISSDAAVGAYPGWGGYGASKAALDLVSRTLAAELKDRSISVVAVDPGDMRTEMHQAAFPGEDISDRPLPEATVPFWAWLLGQPHDEISGQRFRAQADHWGAPG